MLLYGILHTAVNTAAHGTGNATLFTATHRLLQPLPLAISETLKLDLCAVLLVDLNAYAALNLQIPEGGVSVRAAGVHMSLLQHILRAYSRRAHDRIKGVPDDTGQQAAQLLQV